MPIFKVYARKENGEGYFSKDLSNASGILVEMPDEACLSLQLTPDGDSVRICQIPSTTLGFKNESNFSSNFPPTGGLINSDGVTIPINLSELLIQAKFEFGWEVDEDIWKALGAPKE